ncbi:helix-turn-helix domain-containing protein [Paenibacillus sp. FSL H7-0714]|uniref:helix-turn-helix domain-containing protein n=1 Tax=Paenibacillus sp. FSL H7-0714 TaxID=2954735 RepID=UPI0030F98559
MDFTSTVKNILSQNGMKNAELARQAGYSSQHIHDLLSGDRRWNEDSMNKVCDVLGIKVNYQTTESNVEVINQVDCSH